MSKLFVDEVKELFDATSDKKVSYDDFVKYIDDKKIKLADLSSGQYVDKNKMTEELEVSRKQLEALETNNEDLLKNIDKLQKDNLPKDELDKRIAEIKEAHQAELKNTKEAHASFIKITKINDAIRSVGGNPDLLVPYMTTNGLIDKVSIDGENIIGLNDILSTLKTNPTTMSLFPVIEKQNTDTHATQTDGISKTMPKKFETLKDIMDNIDEAEKQILGK